MKLDASLLEGSEDGSVKLDASLLEGSDVDPGTSVHREQPEFFRDKATWFSYLLIGTYCLVLAALGPIMPFLREEEHLNYTLSAFHFSAWSLGSFIAGWCGHIIMRKLGCARTIWVTGFGGVLAVLLLVSIPDPILTISGALIGGLCASTMAQSLITLMSERYGTQRWFYITEANISGSLFAMLAPLVVGRCLSCGLGWRVSLALPVLLFLSLFVSSKGVYSRITQTAKSLEGGPLPRRYWLFYAIIWFSVAAEWSIIFWTSEFLEKAKGFEKVDAVQGVSVFLISMLIGRILSIRLLRLVNPNRLLLGASVVAFGGLLVFWLGSSGVVSLVGLFVAGLGNANIYPTSYAQAIGSAKGKTSLAASRMSTSTGSAVLLASLILGSIGDRFGIFSAYGMVAVVMAITIAMAFLAVLKQPKVSG